MIRAVSAVALATTIAFHPIAAAASEACAADAMLVFDGSGSMAEMGSNGLNTPRIIEAREAVKKAMPFIAPVRRVGLIVYGPRSPSVKTDRCGNVSLHFAPTADAGGLIVSAIGALAPEGETPLTESVAQAAEVLDYTAKPAMIVLVTDGKETCGGSPCQLAGELAEAAKDLTVHVIGFRVRPGFFSWNTKEGETATVAECLAAANGGRYVAAESVLDLATALEETLGCMQLSEAAPVRQSNGRS